MLIPRDDVLRRPGRGSPPPSGPPHAGRRRSARRPGTGRRPRVTPAGPTGASCTLTACSYPCRRSAPPRRSTTGPPAARPPESLCAELRPRLSQRAGATAESDLRRWRRAPVVAAAAAQLRSRLTWPWSLGAQTSVALSFYPMFYRTVRHKSAPNRKARQTRAARTACDLHQRLLHRSLRHHPAPRWSDS